MRYNPALDGIRAIAIIFVLGWHSTPRVFDVGLIGVDVFLVLSGYLITTILVDAYQRTGRVDLRTFYVRRARRLYPALLLMLAAYVSLAPFVFPDVSLQKALSDAALAATYVSNYTFAYTGQPYYLLHTWSLSMEEQFYLIWPLMLLGLLKVPRSRAIAILVGIYLFVLWQRAFAEASAMNSAEFYYTFHMRCTGLLVGALAALCLPAPKLSPRNASLVAFASAGAIIYLGTASRQNYFDFVIPEVELLTVSLIYAALHRPPLLSSPFLAQIGKYSYSLYLWHFPIFKALAPYPDVALPVGLALSFAAAALSYHTVERFHRERRHRENSRPVTLIDEVAAIDCREPR